MSIRGEGVLQDGTFYSRELSVIETLENDGSTKETSEETIKIGQEKVLNILCIFCKVLCILGVGDWGEEGWELCQGGGPGQDSSFYGFVNHQSFWFCQILETVRL